MKIHLEIEIPEGRFCDDCLFIVWDEIESLYRCRLVKRQVHGYHSSCLYKDLDCPGREK